MCELCREKWGSEIYDGIDAFLDEWPGAESGPAHIVLSDLNLEEEHIRWCLGLIVGELQRRGRQSQPQNEAEAKGVSDLQGDAFKNNPAYYADHDETELLATEHFLRTWLMPRAAAVTEHP